MKSSLFSPSVVTSGQFAYFPIFSVVLSSFAFRFTNVVSILFSPYCFQRAFLFYNSEWFGILGTSYAKDPDPLFSTASASLHYFRRSLPNLIAYYLSLRIYVGHH